MRPLMKFYEEMGLSRVLIPHLPPLSKNITLADIVCAAEAAYDFAIRILQTDSRSLVLSASSSACLVLLHLMLRLGDREYPELQKLHFRKGPNLIHRPNRKSFAAAIGFFWRKMREYEKKLLDEKQYKIKIDKK